jgi:hypothetical protein
MNERIMRSFFAVFGIRNKNVRLSIYALYFHYEIDKVRGYYIF